MINFENVDKIYLGTTEIDKLYLGTTELYKKKEPVAAYTVVGDLVKEGNYYKGFNHGNNAYIDCGRVRFDPQSEWRVRFTAKNTTTHGSITRDMIIFFADPDTKICYGCIGGYNSWARPVAYGSGVEGTGTGTSYSIYYQPAAPSGVIINPLTDTTGADISLEIIWNGFNGYFNASNTGYKNLQSAMTRNVKSNNWKIFDSPNLHMYIGALPSDIPCTTSVQTVIDGIDVDSISITSGYGTWDAVNGFVENKYYYELNDNVTIIGTPRFNASSGIAASFSDSSYFMADGLNIDIDDVETELYYEFTHDNTNYNANAYTLYIDDTYFAVQLISSYSGIMLVNGYLFSDNFQFSKRTLYDNKIKGKLTFKVGKNNFICALYNYTDDGYVLDKSISKPRNLDYEPIIRRIRFGYDCVGMMNLANSYIMKNGEVLYSPVIRKELP